MGGEQRTELKLEGERSDKRTKHNLKMRKQSKHHKYALNKPRFCRLSCCHTKVYFSRKLVTAVTAPSDGGA